MNPLIITPNEIISTISHSLLPTLLVEGSDDLEILTSIERIAFADRINVMPVGGRLALFEIWSRREEIGGAKVAFLADSDLYVFSEIPSELNGIIFTKGYSIENDLLASGRSFRIIGVDYLQQWESVLQQLSHWFASVVASAASSSATKFAYEAGSLFDPETWKLRRDRQLEVLPFESLPDQAKLVFDERLRYIRGRTLLSCLAFFYSETRQKPKYSRDIIVHQEVINWFNNMPLMSIVSQVATTLEVEPVSDSGSLL